MFAPAGAVPVSPLIRWVCRIIFAVSVLLTGPANAKPDVVPANAVALSQLPLEARTTYRLVRSGGPFPYAKDGLVFGNRESVLPRRPPGYYREYTVRTPGAADRGARRIVCGGYTTSRPDACFFTGDHYTSFRQIVE